MDRLCCATEQGKLHFYIVHPKPSHSDDGEVAIVGQPTLCPPSSGASANSSKEDVGDAEQQQQQTQTQSGK